jgi:long-subunit acyl-CoA synthetase (AMP-forming)
VPHIHPNDQGARSEERGARNKVIGNEINRCLATAAHEEQVHRFAIVNRPFSMERGEMTPKLSLCRKVIASNFKQQIELLNQPIVFGNHHKGTKNTKHPTNV